MLCVVGVILLPTVMASIILPLEIPSRSTSPSTEIAANGDFSCYAVVKLYNQFREELLIRWDFNLSKGRSWVHGYGELSSGAFELL